VPFATLDLGALSYLNTRQALRDIIAFRAHISSQLRRNHPGGAAPRWIAFGGSYAAALAVWARAKFPALIDGAVASSATVEAVASYARFDEQLRATVGPTCADALARAMRAVDEALDGATGAVGRAAALRAFEVADGLLGDGEVRLMLADAHAMAVQYGHKELVCGPIVAAAHAATRDATRTATRAAARAASTAGGAAAPATAGTNGSARAARHVDDIEAHVSRHVERALLYALANYTSRYFYPTLEQGGPREYAHAYLGRARHEPGTTGRQWRYQQCAELGWFQDAPTARPVRSARLDSAYHRAACAEIFGAPLWPDTAAVNRRYGGRSPNVTNVLFTHGAEDPWRHVGVPPAGLGPSAPGLLIECDGCSHCVDLRPIGPDDPRELVRARDEIRAHVARWLAPPPPGQSARTWAARTTVHAAITSAIAVADGALRSVERQLSRRPRRDEPRPPTALQPAPV